MRLVKLYFASLLLLGCQAALAQDEDLIDDLPQARKEAAATRAKQKSKQLKKEGVPANDSLPPVIQHNTDLIDDLSPEKKRAAADRAEAQRTKKAIPENLAEALARALHNSPAILVADAKVRQAQAELNEVRQTVVHDLTVAFKRRAHNIDLLPQGSKEAREAVLEDEAKILYLLGAVGEHRAGFDFNNPPGLPVTAGAKRAPEEPGKPATAAEEDPQGDAQTMAGMMSAMIRMAAAPGTATGTGALEKLPENVRSFLNKRIDDLNFQKQPLTDVFDFIHTYTDDEVDFVLQNPEVWKLDPAEPSAANDWVVTFALKDVTVAAALQALADLQGCAFIFRDYGILVLEPSSEQQLLESYRAAGAPMIAPPAQSMMRGASAGVPGMGMMGPAQQRNQGPANPLMAQ